MGLTEKLQRVRKRLLDLRFEHWVLNVLDGRDDGVDDLQSFGELSQVVGGQTSSELVLQHG